MLADALTVSRGFNIPEVSDRLQDREREIQDILTFMSDHTRLWPAAGGHHKIPREKTQRLGVLLA